MKYLLSATLEEDMLRLDERLPLPPGTRVRLIVEPAEKKGEPYSFFEQARALKLEGPADLSARYEEHLYGRSSDE